MLHLTYREGESGFIIWSVFILNFGGVERKIRNQAWTLTTQALKKYEKSDTGIARRRANVQGDSHNDRRVSS